MRRTKSVQFAGTELVVRELTITEIDHLFDLAERATSSTLDNMLDVHHLNTAILAEMVALDPPRLEALLRASTPSGYAPLIEAAKEVNPDFFAMARLLKNRAEILAGLGRILDNASAMESALSSKPDTPTPGTMA